MIVRVAWASSVVSVPINKAGEVTVGRGGAVDVYVRCPDMSRRHLALKITKDGLWVKDLESTNGTTVNGDKIKPGEWVAIRSRQPMFIGDASLVVLEGAATESPRRLVGEHTFGAALRDQLELFEKTHEPFGACMLEVSAEAQWSDCIVGLLDNADVITFLSESSARVILARRTPEEITEMANAFDRALSTFSISRHVDVRACPRDGDTLTQLLAFKDDAIARDTRKPTAPVMLPSPAMQRVYELISDVAKTPASVLVLGETGVGKEVIARSIHKRSARGQAPLVCINCAALPEALLESELFGYERGAFTGAVGTKPGIIESADGGTLLLDEIGELPLSTQAKLLRVLETREVMRLGSLKSQHVDFRLICATNRNLRTEIAQGRFRADFYYRINGITVTVPPLRERVNEIPYLAALFAAHAARKLGKNEPFFEREAITALEAHDWPGNIRELKSVIERAVLLSRGGTVVKENLPDEVLEQDEFPMDDMPTATSLDAPVRVMETEEPPPSSTRLLPRPAHQHTPSHPPVSLKEETDRLEYERIVEALNRFSGNQSRAAEALGITRRALIVRLEKFNIPRPRKLSDH